MSSANYSVTAVLTAHAEGTLVGMSYKSLCDAVDVLVQAGYSAEIVVVLDRPDVCTKEIINNIDFQYPGRVIETDFGDQGLARNRAVQVANGEFIAFLDGDDLWSDNWLLVAMEESKKFDKEVIIHPEINWFFGGVSSLFFNIDQRDPSFDKRFLRVANYWDALCFARTNVHLQYPYSKRDIEKGFAFEDWYWNCVTLEAGILHVVVERTVHFKRRREGSQTTIASGTKSLPPLVA